jgi:hypothetical protein
VTTLTPKVESEKRQTSSLWFVFRWSVQPGTQKKMPIQKTLWKLRAADIETIDELITASSIQ